MSTPLFDYTLRLADTSLVLGHRLSEWCGHGPILEEDIAMTNIALDLVGQSRTLYQYAAQLEGKGRTEDDLAYLRAEREFVNALLAERPNGDFGATMVRQLYFSAWAVPFCEALSNSTDETLAGYAAKAVKEVRYHLRHSADWVIRLGDGTEESHQRTQEAVTDLWTYTTDLFAVTEGDKQLIAAGIAVDMAPIVESWKKTITEVLTTATLTVPTETHMASGSRNGQHSEHLGHLLSDLQYMQRAYPGNTW